MRCRLPEGELDGARIERFEVPEQSLENLRMMIHEGRQTRPGIYTRLVVDGRLWMSDTDAELSDLLDLIFKAREPHVRRVLINGLGLGCALAGVLAETHVEHVDVVEIDRRVLKLVAPHFDDPRVNFIEADAYEQCKRWPKGTRWDVCWNDVWGDPSWDDLADMSRLHRSYGRRVGWQESWSRQALLRERRRDRDYGGYWAARA